MTKDADAVLKVQAARERSASGVERSELVDHKAHIARPMRDAFDVQLVEAFNVVVLERVVAWLWPALLSWLEVSEHAAIGEAHRSVVRRVDRRYDPTVTGEI